MNTKANITFPKEMYETVMLAASHNDTSMAAIVREAVGAWLRDNSYAVDETAVHRGGRHKLESHQLDADRSRGENFHNG